MVLFSILLDDPAFFSTGGGTLRLVIVGVVATTPCRGEEGVVVAEVTALGGSGILLWVWRFR
jgi:hypothetical protein